jgi:hypothetical protein
MEQLEATDGMGQIKLRDLLQAPGWFGVLRTDKDPRPCQRNKMHSQCYPIYL